MRTPAERKSKHAGFSLIELLIVVAIIGIIAAIALPNMIGALQKARQKRSMSDLRTLAGALNVYGIDNGFYPRIGDSTADQLRPHLASILKLVPTKDGWTTLVPYETDDDGRSFTLICLGSNAQPDLPYAYGFTERYRDDIVFNTTQFYQWPGGIQKKN